MERRYSWNLFQVHTSFVLIPLTNAPFAADCAADKSARNLCWEAEEVLLNQMEPV
jgi:hypothetical protein